MACGGSGPGAPGEGPTGDAPARASALLAASVELPNRAEAVALADAVAIASSKKGKSVEGAALARTAGDLRARLWRSDRSEADGREALELYAAAAGAGNTEAGCEADRARAHLAGELSHDAATAFREVYLASRRQSALAPARGGASPCVIALDLALAELVAYRPQGEAMRALERDGNAAAESFSKGGAPQAVTAVAAAAPTGPGTAAIVAPPLASAQVGPSGDLVISPKEDAVPKGPVRLSSIERFGGEQGARVILNLSGPATFQVGQLPADDASGKDARVFVDVAHATAKGVPRETVVGGAVRRVRVGAHPSKGTRVVLDLAASLYRRVFYLPDPFRIVIDVSTRPPGRGEAKSDGQREVRRVVIDPGHGGTDSGAVGPTGLKEKDVTLDIAHRVAPLLSHELKVETLLTRDDDTYVPLDLRTARANAFHADLFVSVHCNASENGAARGVQTFVLSDARESESAATKVAARENAQKGRAIDVKSSAEAAFIASSMDIGGLLGRSRHVADLLQRSALGSLMPRYPDTKDQGIKTAGFFVLVGADMPAVLFETAFISNPEDESRLSKADYRQKLADAIANAIKAYRAGK